MRAILIGAVFAGLALTGPCRIADAGIITTASLKKVVECSSHIVLVRHDGEKGFLPLTWYRGEAREGPLAIRGIPPVIYGPLSSGNFRPGLERTTLSLDRIILFLEEHHGRHHVTSFRRRGDRYGFGGHSSVRLISKKGQVFGFAQVINPGKPKPVPAEESEIASFETHLRKLIGSHPYQPVSHPVKLPPISPKDRDALLALIANRVDLYQGQWHTTYGGWFGVSPDTAGIVKLAGELGEFIENAESKAAALHALDAMMLLSTKTSAGWDHRGAVQDAALRALEHVDPGQARTWVLDEIEHGRSGTDFTWLAYMASSVGERTYEEALRILERWVERTAANKGNGAYWALVRLGHEDRAKRAVARREKRKSANRGKK